MPDKGRVRLNKYLAECGVCSRREADKLIEAGKVTVNGMPADMGMKVDGREEILVMGKAVKSPNEKVVLAYYKPVGITCTEKDAHAEKTVIEAVKYPIRVTYAGRLDKDSEGLLLMTNDGALIQKMMKGREAHEKEYIVKVKREITGDFISRMAQGVYLKELDATTRACRVEQTGKYTFHIILTQGLNRQIRRMCKELGNDVFSIKRIRVLHVGLGSLKPGEYRKLEGKELEDLYAEVENRDERACEQAE